MTTLNVSNLETKLPGTPPRDAADITFLKLLIEQGMTISQILKVLDLEFMLVDMSPANRSKYKQRFKNLYDVYIDKTKGDKSVTKESSLTFESEDILDIFIRTLFQKSKRKTGHIYLCDYNSEKFYIDYETGSITSIEAYKYGRTVNMENRLLQYGERYKLHKSWQTNHVKLREWLIHNHHDLIEQRFINSQHENDEHVIDFDCRDIVEFYATATIRISKLYCREHMIKLIPTKKFTDSWGVLEVDLRNLLYAV